MFVTMLFQIILFGSIFLSSSSTPPVIPEKFKIAKIGSDVTFQCAINMHNAFLIWDISKIRPGVKLSSAYNAVYDGKFYMRDMPTVSILKRVYLTIKNVSTDDMKEIKCYERSNVSNFDTTSLLLYDNIKCESICYNNSIFASCETCYVRSAFNIGSRDVNMSYVFSYGNKRKLVKSGHIIFYGVAADTSFGNCTIAKVLLRRTATCDNENPLSAMLRHNGGIDDYLYYSNSVKVNLLYNTSYNVCTNHSTNYDTNGATHNTSYDKNYHPNHYNPSIIPTLRNILIIIVFLLGVASVMLLQRCQRV